MATIIVLGFNHKSNNRIPHRPEKWKQKGRDIVETGQKANPEAEGKDGPGRAFPGQLARREPETERGSDHSPQVHGQNQESPGNCPVTREGKEQQDEKDDENQRISGGQIQ